MAGGTSDQLTVGVSDLLLSNRHVTFNKSQTVYAFVFSAFAPSPPNQSHRVQGKFGARQRGKPSSSFMIPSQFKKSGRARSYFLSTLKPGWSLCLFQVEDEPNWFIFLPISPQIIFHKRCFDVCTPLASTHRYTKDNYSILGMLGGGGVDVFFCKGM